ncbi:transposase [Spirillospora sp. NPDC000708]
MRPRRTGAGSPKDLRQIYTAPTEAAAELRFADFEAEWGGRYPVIIRLWRDVWRTFTPFLAFRPRSADRLHRQRDREPERPVPPGHPPARALPH